MDEQDAAAVLLADDAWRRVGAVTMTAERELAATGHHRVALPDLLVAACAQQNAADVLHVDRHFDVLTTVLTFRALRLDG